jgi:hypothetical protein
MKLSLHKELKKCCLKGSFLMLRSEQESKAVATLRRRTYIHKHVSSRQIVPTRQTSMPFHEDQAKEVLLDGKS